MAIHLFIMLSIDSPVPLYYGFQLLEFYGELLGNKWLDNNNNNIIIP